MWRWFHQYGGLYRCVFIWKIMSKCTWRRCRLGVQCYCLNLIKSKSETRLSSAGYRQSPAHNGYWIVRYGRQYCCAYTCALWFRAAMVEKHLDVVIADAARHGHIDDNPIETYCLRLFFCFVESIQQVFFSHRCMRARAYLTCC